MNQLFSGQTRTRPSINLSGSGHESASAGPSASSSSSLSLSERAKLEREKREAARRTEAAARRVQHFWRAAHAGAAARDRIRLHLDGLLATLNSDDAATAVTTTTSNRMIDATAALALVYRPRNKGDLARLAAWARLAATGKPRVRLFTPFSQAADTSTLSRYTHALTVLSDRMLQVAAEAPSIPSIPLFLELVKQLLDPTKYRDFDHNAQAFPSQLASKLVARGALAYIGRHIENCTRQPVTQGKPPPPSFSPAMSITLSLLTRYPQRDMAIHNFILYIMTIPRLTATDKPRLPNTPLQNLVGPKSQIPFYELLSALSDSSTLLQQVRPHAAVHLLSNLVNIGKARIVANAPQSKQLVNMLDVYRACLQRIPSETLSAIGVSAVQHDLKGKSRETAISLDDDGDTVMNGSSSTSPTGVDTSTAASIVGLAREPFLGTIIRTSTHYSAGTRPSLFSFLVTLLYAFPSSSGIKESTVNTLVYSSAVDASRGLLRELWRGWIRSSALSRALVQGSSTSSVTSAVAAALANPTFKSDWPNLILLAEMYSRCLLTLGDDEFFANPAAGSGTSDAMSRNPLSIDEVIGFSALWRNIAFALYWQPDLLNEQNGKERHVVGTTIPLEALRKLATGLLQSLHARDSRKQFAPRGHWIMTSQLDLQSFVESAILEDQKLDEEDGDGNSVPTSRMNIDSDSDVDDQPSIRRAHAASRRNLPTRRQMAFLSPRLGVLNNIPFVIPFEVRVSIFQQFIANDRAKLHRNASMGQNGRSRFSVGVDGRGIAAAATIRRGHVADDGFATLSGLGNQLKERLAIRFMDQYGQEEAGIDGGGLFKEFLTELSKEAFDVDRGLWLETPSHELYPAATSYSRESFSLQWYAFLGQIMGKALYEGILVDVPFAPFFLSKWLGRSSGFDDLASFEPELYQGLVQLKNYPGDVEKDLSLNFTVTDDDFGVSRTIELVPNGSNIAVTNENRISYIYRVSDYRLNKQISAQCSAFFSGLSDLINPKWLRMFNTVELGLLVGGAETSIDIDDLRHNTIYSRGFDESHETVQYFWKVVNNFSQEDKKALVKFCTSCPRPPLLGFGQLNPKFAIGNGGSDEERMPSTSTCVNLLKLPTYSSPDKLRQKLLASIHSGAGFDLS